jgi:hypothetical protein
MSQHTGERRPRTLAGLALGFAIAGTVLVFLAFVPFAPLFANASLIAGTVLAIVALAVRRHGGKGLGIAALVTAGVGWLAQPLLWVTTLAVAALGSTSAPWYAGPPPDLAGPPPVVSSYEVVAPNPRHVTTPASDPRHPEPWTVLETAFGPTETPGRWWWAVVLENPNPDHYYDLAIDVDALDATGRAVGSGTDSVLLLYGRTVMAGVFYSVDTEVASLRVQAMGTGTEAISSPAEQTGGFTIDPVWATDDDGIPVVHGVVYGDFETPAPIDKIAVLARMPDGTIAGAGSARGADPDADGWAEFDAPLEAPVPADAVLEVYVTY